MRHFLSDSLSFFRKNAIELCITSLILFSLVNLYQAQITYVARTFGVTTQVNKIQEISNTDQPQNLGNMPDGNKAYLKINFEFRSNGSPGYQNLFQTDMLNSGIRAELYDNSLALVYPSPTVKGSAKVVILAEKLNPGRWYSFHLEALNGAFIKAGISETGVFHTESENPEFGTDSFKIGIGFDDIRRFGGDIRNVEITKGIARQPKLGNILINLIILGLLALIVIYLVVGSKNNSFTRIRLYQIAILHILCQVMGFSYLVHKDDIALRELFDLGDPIFSMLPLDMPPLPPITNSLITYIFLLLIGISSVLATFAKNKWRIQLDSSGRVLLGLLIAYEAVCMALPLIVDSLGGLWVWVAIVSLLPAYMFFNRRHLRRPIYTKMALLVCLVLVGGVVGNLLFTSWNPSLRFINDYADLPEYTLLQNGKEVENRSFLQKHSVEGEFYYDPCDPPGNGFCMHLPRYVFANERVPFNIFPPGGGLIYDWNKEVLKGYRAITAQDKKTIHDLWGVDSIPKQITQINANISESSSEVDDFLYKNRIELVSQMNLGRFFYHHAFLYLPALEVAKSLTTKVTPAQYGKGFTQTFGSLLRIIGPLNFQTYYKIYWIALITYLGLLGAVAAWLAKDKWVGIAALAVGIVCTLSIGPDALRMAPGFNPARHLPDLFCFVVIAIDSRKNTFLSALLRSVAIASFVWWNKEFGIFLLFGSVAWHFLNVVAGDQQWRAGFWRVAIEVILSALILALSSTGGNNGLAFYNIMGVGTPLTRWHDVVFWMAIWVPAIGLTAWGRFILLSKSPKEAESLRSLLDVSGVGLIYSGFTSVYALWNPASNHYPIVALTSVLPFAMVFIWLHQILSAQNMKLTWLPKYIAAIASIMLLPFAYHDQMLFRGYKEIFKEHRTFEWRFPGLAGISTADPKLLEEAEELIQKYQPEGRILFVSRYDTLMSILLNRSGILPYVEIPSSIVSWKMIDRISEKINESKPTYIFVDRDLQADREWAVTYRPQDKSIVSPIENRIGSLAALDQVFRIVMPCYAPGEVKGILQVWHRTCK